MDSIQEIKDDRTLYEMRRQKNNEELDRLCKKICLCVGWSLVILFMIYITYLLIRGPPK